MIHISEDFFSNSPLFGSNSGPIIPEEVKDPRYGYSPRIEELRYKNLYSGPELDSTRNLHNLLLTIRKNPRAISTSEIASLLLGFGSLGMHGFSYYINMQFIPLYILEHFLKTVDKNELLPLIYKNLLVEYNVRHELNEMYLRPLDVFYVHDLPDTINEEFFSPLSPDAYSRFFDISEYSSGAGSDLNLGIYRVRSFRTLPLRELHRILLYLNRNYINADNAEIGRYNKPYDRDSLLTEELIGARPVYWALGIFNELEKREKEYKTLIERPENVLFTI